jgi:thymidylate synthase
MLEFNFVLCTDINGGISKDEIIPWNIKEDTIYFKDVVTRKIDGKPNVIICGNKTFQQMGSFKNHLTIVLSRNSTSDNDNVKIMASVNDVLTYLVENKSKYGKIFVCGGKKVYNNFFELCYQTPNNFHGVIYASMINKNYECDNHISHDFLCTITQQMVDYKHIHNHHNKFNYGVDLYLYDSHNNTYVVVSFLKPFVINNNTNNVLTKYNNHHEIKYLELIERILDQPFKVGRNGKTKSLFGEILKFDLKYNKFPLLTTKRVYFKGVFEELMFFIRGDTNSKHLSEKDVKIWEPNTTKEFIHNCGLNYEEGDMGPMYGFQWLHYNADYHGMHHEYTGKGFNQIEYVINELKTNPTSRRIIMTTYNPIQAKEGVLFPCHGISIIFNAEQDLFDTTGNTYFLNIMQTQRSCDYFLGVPFNIASYSLLVYMLCEILNNDDSCKYKYKPGELIMSLGDYHLYESHLEEAKRQLIRTPSEFPNIQFKEKIYKLEDFKFEDIILTNYNPCPEIKAKMVS